MKRSIVLLVVAFVVTACSGSKSEGDPCGGSRDDCGTDLTCQPIEGHGDVCCPAPPSSSDKATCHAVTST